MRGTPGSACPQPEPNATELPSSAPGRPKLIELQANKPSPTPTRAEENIATTPGCGPAGYSGHRAFAPRRHEPRNTSPRRWVVDMQAAAPSPTPTRRAPRRAADRAPPRPRPPARALTHRLAPKRTPHVAGLQTSPRCRRELRTSPGCRPRRASRPRTHSHTPTCTKETSPRATLLTTPTRAEGYLAVTPGCRLRAPDALLPTPTRTEKHLAVTPGCRPRAPDAKARGRCLENRPWA